VSRPDFDEERSRRGRSTPQPRARFYQELARIGISSYLLPTVAGGGGGKGRAFNRQIVSIRCCRMIPDDGVPEKFVQSEAGWRQGDIRK
jgi:hypothetical protein